jgi:epsilon-lactone hydrolase
MTRSDMTSAHNGPQPQQYEIWVRGHLGETMRSAFPALRAQPRGKDTVLTGALPDQAALYGVLVEIEALGLELLEVRHLPPH